MNFTSSCLTVSCKCYTVNTIASFLLNLDDLTSEFACGYYLKEGKSYKKRGRKGMKRRRERGEGEQGERTEQESRQKGQVCVRAGIPAACCCEQK